MEDNYGEVTDNGKSVTSFFYPCISLDNWMKKL